MTDTHEIKFDKIIDITVVEALYSELEKALSGHGSVDIDASQVERVDTSTLQLIYTFKEQISANGYKLKWTGVSDNFFEIATLLGLDEKLDLDSAGIN
ncbi:MAG: hypothetical protein COB04_01720 [Gammaproteobacteria bacterium]|nr:MAG: hypothetical protein COB04_01720 [Gammaproteobacteria bacterium]